MVYYKGKPYRVLLSDGERMVIVDKKGKSHYIKRNELDMYGGELYEK